MLLRCDSDFREKFYLVTLANCLSNFFFPQQMVSMVPKLFWNLAKCIGVLDVGFNQIHH